MRTLILLFALAGASYAQGWASSFTSNTFQSVCPSGTYSSTGNPNNGSAYTDTCKNVMYAWGGSFIDTKRNRMIIFGGGHSDHPGNEIYALTVSGSSGVFSRLTAPSTIAPDYSLCPETLGSGGTLAPNSRHTYSNNVYIEHADRYFIFGGGVYCGAGRNYADTWIWNPNVGDLTTNGWTQKDPVTNGGGQVPYHQAIINSGSLSAGAANWAINLYDRETRMVYVQWEDQLWKYDYDNNTYTRLATYGNAITPYRATGVIDPVRRVMMYIGRKIDDVTPAIYEIDMKSGTTWASAEVTSSYSGCSSLSGAQYPALNYDPAIDKIVGYPGTGNTVYIMDTVAKTCSSVSVFTGAPTISPQSAGIFGRFAYFPSIGKYAVVNNHTSAAYTFTLNYTAIHGLGSSTLTCLDKDGDGYGVGCTNPDADDLDSSVRTANEGIAKYGSFTAFLGKLGYNPTRIWYIAKAADNGNDGTCVVNNVLLPCASWTPINSAQAAGDMVIVRGGTYTTLSMTPINGTSGNPIIFLSYPGERAILSSSLSKPTTTDKSYHIFDGFKFQTSSCLDAGTNDGNPSSLFHNNQYKNLEGTGCQWGFAAFNGLNDIVITDNSFHDNNPSSGEHGIYIGSRALTSTTVHVRRNLLYGNARNGIHMNGRVYNAQVEQNWAYNNELPGIDMQNGVSRSYIRANTSFNNNSGSLSIYNYGSGQCTSTGDGTGDICPYDQTGNVIENNTFYATGFEVDGTPNIGHYAIKVANCSPGETGNLGGNTFRNNILVNPGSIRYAPVIYINGDQSGTGCTNFHVNSTTAAYLSTSTFTNNVFKNNDGSVSTKFIGYGLDASFGYTGYDCTAAAALTTLSGCTNSDPLFTAASTSYYNSASSFDFRLQSSSPAKAAGTTLGAPLFDSLGTAYSLSTPNIGAFESAATGGSTSTGTRISGSARISGVRIQ